MEEHEGYEAWQRQFHRAVVTFALGGKVFTSEDVTSLIGMPPGKSNSAVGAMMNGAANTGRIKKTGRYVPSRAAKSHGSVIVQWVGVSAKPKKVGARCPTCGK